MTVQSPFKWRHFEAEIILRCVRWYLRYALSYRDLEEITLERGLLVDHTTIYRWVQRYAPELEKRSRPHLFSSYFLQHNRPADRGQSRDHLSGPGLPGRRSIRPQICYPALRWGSRDLFFPKRKYREGTMNRLSTVEVIRPPRMTSAIGCSIS
jgi:hypothetical protein